MMACRNIIWLWLTYGSVSLPQSQAHFKLSYTYSIALKASEFTIGVFGYCKQYSQDCRYTQVLTSIAAIVKLQYN